MLERQDITLTRYNSFIAQICVLLSHFWVVAYSYLTVQVV